MQLNKNTSDTNIYVQSDREYYTASYSIHSIDDRSYIDKKCINLKHDFINVQPAGQRIMCGKGTCYTKYTHIYK